LTCGSSSGACTFFSLLTLFVVSAAVFLRLADITAFETELDVAKRLLLFLLVLTLVLFVPARRHSNYSWSLDEITRIEKNVLIVAISTLPTIGFVFVSRHLKRVKQLVEIFGITVHRYPERHRCLVIITLAATFGIAATSLRLWRQPVTRER
jgi:hypothetical protein